MSLPLTGNTNPLSPSSLLALLPSLLPPSSPTLTSPTDALVALLHTVHIALGFRFALASDYTNDRVLSVGWNADAPKSYELEYKHEQSGMKFLVTVGKLGERAVVNAMAVEDDKPYNYSVPLSTSFAPLTSFPFTAPSQSSSTAPASDDPVDRSANTTPVNDYSLLDAYVSETKLQQLVDQHKKEVVVKLIPSLGKEGYEEGSSTPSSTTIASASSSSSHPASRVQVNPPTMPSSQPPARSFIPPLGGAQPPNFPNIGSSDLDPLAASPNAFRPPSLFPGSSRPPPTFPGAAGSGGMYMDPSAFIRGGRPQAGGGIPDLSRPPGARWDPTGPFQPPGGGGGGFHPPGGGFMGGDPDNDEFLPPGGLEGARDMGVRFPGQWGAGAGRGRGGGGGFPNGAGGFGGGFGGGGGGFA